MREQDVRLVAEPAGELVDQTRLAQAWRSEDDGQAGCTLGDGRVIYGRNAPQLVLAPDERDRRRARGSFERHHAVRRHGLGPALQAEAAQRRERHELGNQPARRLPDHHVAVAGLLLKSGRDVHRIADDLARVVCDDLTGVDRDTQTGLAHHGKLLVGELAEGLLHRDRRAHGADGVVLGHARRAEDGLHPVPEQLRDRAAVRLDRGPHRPVVALHEAAGGLRVEAFVQRRRSDQIGEDDRDDLARLESGDR